DEPILVGWQSGPLYVDLTPKPSSAAFQQAIAAAAGGTVDCASLKGGLPSGDFMPPTAPSGLAGAASTGPPRVDLPWAAATDNVGVASYEISRDGVVLGTSTGTTYRDTGVTSDTAYVYSVIALDGAGNRSAAGTVSITTPDLAPPTAPATVTANASDGPPRVD